MTDEPGSRQRPRRRTVVLAGLVAITAACGRGNGSEEETMTLESGTSIDDAIVTIWEDGGRQPLTEIVDVEFDELLVFPEGTEAARINEAAGGPLLSGEYYQSSTQLFLFRAEGRSVLAAMISSDVFTHDVQNATFGPQVSIVGEGGKELITLEE